MEILAALCEDAHAAIERLHRLSGGRDLRARSRRARSARVLALAHARNDVTAATRSSTSGCNVNNYLSRTRRDVLGPRDGTAGEYKTAHLKLDVPRATHEKLVNIKV